MRVRVRVRVRVKTRVRLRARRYSVVIVGTNTDGIVDAYIYNSPIRLLHWL